MSSWCQDILAPRAFEPSEALHQSSSTVPVSTYCCSYTDVVPIPMASVELEQPPLIVLDMPKCIEMMLVAFTRPYLQVHYPPARKYQDMLHA